MMMLLDDGDMVILWWFCMFAEGSMERFVEDEEVKVLMVFLCDEGDEVK